MGETKPQVNISCHKMKILLLVTKWSFQYWHWVAYNKVLAKGSHWITQTTQAFEYGNQECGSFWLLSQMEGKAILPKTTPKQFIENGDDELVPIYTSLFDTDILLLPKESHKHQPSHKHFALQWCLDSKTCLFNCDTKLVGVTNIWFDSKPAL